MKQPTFFGSASLGIALHAALAQIYGEWHYQDPLPDLEWIYVCWNQHCQALSAAQVAEGQVILEKYYFQFMAAEGSLRRPVAVEGKIQGHLQVANLEFTLTGRYDRLDSLDQGLELLDYKSGKEMRSPDPAEIDLQIGLYFIALEQHYQQSLRQLSLVYLRQGKKVSFQATPEHRDRAQEIIQTLALQLRMDEEWQPTCGEHCDRCSYRRYCPAIQVHPEPLPTETQAFKDHPRPVQLVLGL
jgi:putative RecB family exonuclease